MFSIPWELGQLLIMLLCAILGWQLRQISSKLDAVELELSQYRLSTETRLVRLEERNHASSH